jgi:Holliday junction resolvase RusA-like endonuclease
MLTVIAYGTPAPQGSKRLVGRDGKGRGILVESIAKVRPWREAVKFAALEVAGRVAGAVSVQMTFTMPKPKSAPKTRKTWPATRPDLSKLVRSTEDALTDAGAWEDDARVVYCIASKVYPGEDVNALDKPGVVIRIQEASGETTNSTCLSSGCSLDAEDPLRSVVESCGPPGTSIVGAASSLLRSPVGKQLRSRPRRLRDEEKFGICRFGNGSSGWMR